MKPYGNTGYKFLQLASSFDDKAEQPNWMKIILGIILCLVVIGTAISRHWRNREKHYVAAAQDEDIELEDIT